jgi:hypothetical protein
MTDLVERLRSFHHTNSVYGAAQDAADRIEALEALLRELYLFVEPLNDFRPDSPLARKVRAALDKDDGK